MLVFQLTTNNHRGWGCFIKTPSSTVIICCYLEHWCYSSPLKEYRSPHLPVAWRKRKSFHWPKVKWCHFLPIEYLLFSSWQHFLFCGDHKNVRLWEINKHDLTKSKHLEEYATVILWPIINTVLYNSLVFTISLSDTNSELKITGDHLCDGEIFQDIFSQIGWKYSEKSLLHRDDRQLF